MIASDNTSATQNIATMKTARIIYITAWAIPLLLALLYLLGVIKVSEKQVDASTKYVLSLISVVLTLATAYLSLRLFHFGFIRKWLKTGEEGKTTNKNEKKARLCSYPGLCTVREVAILAVCLIDLASYYVHQTESSLYLTGIMLITLIFCYPDNQ